MSGPKKDTKQRGRERSPDALVFDPLDLAIYPPLETTAAALRDHQCEDEVAIVHDPGSFKRKPKGRRASS